MHNAVAVAAERPLWSTVLGEYHSESGTHGGTDASAALAVTSL